MYVTRPLSQLRVHPEVLAQPEGPNSGCLLIQDEESETYSCFGLRKNRTLKVLPFPQNKELTVRYSSGPHSSGPHSSGPHSSGPTSNHSQARVDSVFLIPALNWPLSSNRYYAIVPHGKHKGEAFTCSREEDMVACCFCRCIKDVKSRPLDPRDVYQQFEVVPDEVSCIPRKGDFSANSIASDGFPPSFLRRNGWTIHTKTAENCKLDRAEGINYEIRARLPEFNFPLSLRSSASSVVGKWYCPFMFVKEGTLRDQVKKSMYYQITLEQRWERIFTCSRGSSRKNSVAIDALVEKEEAFIDEVGAVWKERDGVVWFTTKGEERSLGLRLEVVQRMKWEEERFGYRSGEERQVKIEKVEECPEELGEWSEFGCCVLVERFNLLRMDWSLVMCYEFKHLDKMKTKWELSKLTAEASSSQQSLNQRRG